MEFLFTKNGSWFDTGLKCPRDEESIHREVEGDGKLTDHFSCSRSGCTWASYPANVDALKRQLSYCDCPGLPSYIELEENKCLACNRPFKQNVI